MIKRFKTSIGVIAGLGALALGGSAIAAAGTPSKPAHAKPAATSTTTDPGPNVQQGDQTTPDTGIPAPESATGAAASTTDTGPNVQEGDQTAPDTGTPSAESAAEASKASEPVTAENAPESASSATDLPGGPSSDVQQQGQH